MKLLISDKGEIFLETTQEFQEEVSRVEFYLETKLMVIEFKESEGDGQLLESQVNEMLIPYLQKASTILVVCLDHKGNVKTGYRVPLIFIS